MGLAPSGKAFGWITLRRMRALWWEFERQSPPVDENLLHTQARQIVLHRNAPGNTSNSNFSVKSRNLVVSRLSVVPLKIGNNNCKPGETHRKTLPIGKITTLDRVNLAEDRHQHSSGGLPGFWSRTNL